ncbi:hypothetical protein Q5752_004469 [Cryptotrichosporon argae]
MSTPSEKRAVDVEQPSAEQATEPLDAPREARRARLQLAFVVLLSAFAGLLAVRALVPSCAGALRFPILAALVLSTATFNLLVPHLTERRALAVAVLVLVDLCAAPVILEYTVHRPHGGRLVLAIV